MTLKTSVLRSFFYKARSPYHHKNYPILLCSYCPRRRLIWLQQMYQQRNQNWDSKPFLQFCYTSLKRKIITIVQFLDPIYNYRMSRLLLFLYLGNYSHVPQVGIYYHRARTSFGSVFLRCRNKHDHCIFHLSTRNILLL